MEPRIGMRVRMVKDLDFFPHYDLTRGMTGTVAAIDEDRIDVKMDCTIAGMEEWENHSHFKPNDDSCYPQLFLFSESCEEIKPPIQIELGTKVKILKDHEFFYFWVTKGMTGTVVECNEEEVTVLMDEHINGAEEWHNTVIFTHDFTTYDSYELRFKDACEIVAETKTNWLSRS